MSFLYLWKSVVQYFCEDGLYINILSSIIRLSIKVGFDFPKTLVTILLPFFWQEKAPFKTLTCPNSRDSSLFFMEKHPISPCLYRMDFQAVWHASVATICSAWGAWASAPLDSWLWRCQDLRFRRCGRSCGNSWIWFCMILYDLVMCLMLLMVFHFYRISFMDFDYKWVTKNNRDSWGSNCDR